MTTSSNDQNNLLKDHSRQAIWVIWQAGKAGEALRDEDARLYQVMLEHPEHTQLWDRLNTASDADIMQDDANLVLHILFHQAAENQLALDTPPATRQVLKVLMQMGQSRHEAVHLIAGAIAWETVKTMQEKRPYNERRFLRELRKLPLKVRSKPRK